MNTPSNLASDLSYWLAIKKWLAPPTYSTIYAEAIFRRVHATLHPALSVSRLVGRSVPILLFYQFYFYVILSHFRVN